MNADEQLLYLYALDLRIAEIKEELAWIEAGRKSVFLSISDKRLLWEQYRCPLCWLYLKDEKVPVDCDKCPAGDEEDNFCREFVMWYDRLEKTEGSDVYPEVAREYIEILEKQRRNVGRRHPLQLLG